MASESNDFFFRRIRLLHKLYYLINILSMKNEVYMCYISTELNFCRLHGGIKYKMIA